MDTVFHTVRPGNAHATAIAHGMKGFYCFVGDFGFSFDRSVQLDRWEVGSEITVKVQRPRRKDAKMKVVDIQNGCCCLGRSMELRLFDPLAKSH